MTAGGRHRPSAAPALMALAMLLGTACTGGSSPAPPSEDRVPSEVIALPPPWTAGLMSVEEALAARRSGREYASAALSTAEVGQLLWAAQGLTEVGGAGRTAPSAGGTYPLEIYAITAEGLFHYLPTEQALAMLGRDDLRERLSEAALGQAWVRTAPVVLAIVAVTGRTTERYGDRGERYVALEAGHTAQNVLLQATAMGLAAVPVGAFTDGQVQSLLGLPEGWTPLYLIPVGRPAGG